MTMKQFDTKRKQIMLSYLQICPCFIQSLSCLPFHDLRSMFTYSHTHHARKHTVVYKCRTTWD